MSVRCRKLSTAVTATALAVALAGCGGGSGTGAAPATPSVAADSALAAMVPKAVSADGKIVFGTDASYAPDEFTGPDGTSIIGMDVDLGTAVAQKLGLTAEFQNSAFDGILPGIQAKRYELGMSSFSITDERVKTVDMVSYFTAGTALASAKGNPLGITLDNLCGKAVGVQRGTVQVDDLTARTKKCTDAGQPAIMVSEFQLQTDVNLALASNRVVAMLADSPVVGYAVKLTNGAVQAVGAPYDAGPYGIALAKNQGDFAKAVQGAVQALINDGTYKTILDKWNTSAGAIPTSEVRS